MDYVEVLVVFSYVHMLHIYNQSMTGRKKDEKGLQVRDYGNSSRITPSWPKDKYPQQQAYINSMKDVSGAAVEKIMQGLLIMQGIDEGKLEVREISLETDYEILLPVIHELKKLIEDVKGVLHGVKFSESGDIEEVLPDAKARMAELSKMLKA